MRIFFAVFLAALPIFCDTTAQGQGKSKKADRVPVIATSGDVEIASIRIAREVVSDAAPYADLTNMTIGLWLAQKAPAGNNGQFFVKLDELGPIEDDTGKVLLTKKRAEQIKYLKGDATSPLTQGLRGKVGPVIELTLDVPARQATKIKAIKGKATTARMSHDQLRFENVAAFSGKQLDHPKLKGFPIRATLRVEDGSTTVTLFVPIQRAKLTSWALVGKDGDRLRNDSESQSREKNEIVLEQDYMGDHSKGTTLVLNIAERFDHKTIEFEFKDVPLP